MIKVGSVVKVLQYNEGSTRQNWMGWFFDAVKYVPAKVVKIEDGFCDVKFIRPVSIPRHGTWTELNGYSLSMFKEINASEKSSEYED